MLLSVQDTPGRSYPVYLSHFVKVHPRACQTRCTLLSRAARVLLAYVDVKQIRRTFTGGVEREGKSERQTDRHTYIHKASL